MKTKMTRENAIKKVGMQKGAEKFHNYMEGAFLPVGSLTEAEVIFIIYGGIFSSILMQLKEAEENEYQRLLKKNK